MTLTQAQPRAIPQRSAPLARPLKILAVIDASERIGRLIDHALSLAPAAEPLSMVLLGLIRQSPDGRLRGYGSFMRDQVNAHLKEVFDLRPISAAGRRCDKAGVVHTDRVEIGKPADTILRVAREERCDLILVSAAPASAWQRWLPEAVGLVPATVESRLVQRAPLPVIVIK